jgi:hypothetical protein
MNNGAFAPLAGWGRERPTTLS